ncbi:MAG TPA: Tat pathway signal protein [Rhodobacteraceae bacterium]|jgi:hypothetical protein|nr:Tat pathway signal protein [Paracoccaceae bacterium]HBV55676.1 Tat pathway signal protein [Paracoccaceae bacterium]
MTTQKLTRRRFLATALATPVTASGLRYVPSLAKAPPVKRVLTLAYDKSLGMMRAIDQIVP